MRYAAFAIEHYCKAHRNRLRRPSHTAAFFMKYESAIFIRNNIIGIYKCTAPADFNEGMRSKGENTSNISLQTRWRN